MNHTQGTKERTVEHRPTGRALVACLVVVLAAATARPDRAFAAPAQESATAKATVEERLAGLEALVAKLRSEIGTLRASATAGAPAPGAQTALEELQKRIDALALEIERLRIGEAAAPAAGEKVAGFGPAASKVYGIRRGVSIGGYGEMLYQNFDPRADDGSASGL